MGRSKDNRSHWLPARLASKAGVPVKAASVSQWWRAGRFKANEWENRPMPPGWHLRQTEERYYDPAAVCRVYKSLHQVSHADKMKAVNAVGESITDEKGEVLVRRGVAARMLGVTPECLRKWTFEGCLILDGAKLSSVVLPWLGGVPRRYWYKSELEKVRQLRDKYRRTVADDKHYTPRQTAERTGLSLSLLEHESRKAQDLGLVVVRRNIVTRFSKGNAASRAETVRPAIAYTCESVDKFVAERPRPVRPANKFTVAQAAQKLNRSECTIREWIQAGILRGTPNQAYIENGLPRVGWLIEADSVHAAAAVIRRHGTRRPSRLVLKTATAEASMPSGAPALASRPAHQPKPATHDGPADPYLFRFAGCEIDLSEATLRHRLLTALWESEREQPFASVDVADVLEAIYPDDDSADGNLKVLQSRTNKALAAKSFPLAVRSAGGKIWLESTSK
jgi:hypothetical protein